MNADPIEITAEELCRALYGEGVEGINRGTYPGTAIPVRQVPPAARLIVVCKPAGIVTDSEGGWIADRFGPGLGVRECKRVLAYLKTGLTKGLGFDTF